MCPPSSSSHDSNATETPALPGLVVPGGSADSDWCLGLVINNITEWSQSYKSFTVDKTNAMQSIKDLIKII